MSETNVTCIVPIVLKTLRKLTRSLRFRIYYYCEPCVANKKQKVMLNDILLFPARQTARRVMSVLKQSLK